MTIVDMTAIPDDDVIAVTSLSDSVVSYKTPTGIEREFPPKATFKIKAGELRELSYDRGGKILLQNYLRVDNRALAREFGVRDDTIEYDWTDEDVDTALTTASMETLLDALDFAPKAIKNRLVNRAVELEISDINRMEAISKATGLNVLNMIKNKRAIAADAPKEEKHGRRVQQNKQEESTGRRVKV